MRHAALALIGVMGFGGVCGASPRVWDEDVGGNGHAYDVIVCPSGISWEGARVIAQMLGGDLAAPETDAENVFIFSIAAGVDGAWRTYPLGRGRSVTLGPWLGGLQHEGGREPSGGWAWVSGVDIAGRAWWALHEPNDRPVDGSNENRVCYIGIGDKPSPFWNDARETPTGTGGEPGIRVTAFVVEYDPK